MIDVLSGQMTFKTHAERKNNSGREDRAPDVLFAGIVAFIREQSGVI